MKKLVLLLGAVMSAVTADATVLFPFYGDVAPDNNIIVRMVKEDGDDKFEQIVRKGKSGMGSLDDCVSFLNDVVPDDVTKGVYGRHMSVFTSPFHKRDIDTVDAKGNKVSAIYVVNTAEGVMVYYTESDELQQREWQSAIEKGEM